MSGGAPPVAESSDRQGAEPDERQLHVDPSLAREELEPVRQVDAGQQLLCLVGVGSPLGQNWRFVVAFATEGRTSYSIRPVA